MHNGTASEIRFITRVNNISFMLRGFGTFASWELHKIKSLELLKCLKFELECTVDGAPSQIPTLMFLTRQAPPSPTPGA